MAEKVVTTVGNASNIETIFVNDGTDIKQATPELLLNSMAPIDDASARITAEDTSIATVDGLKLKKSGHVVTLTGSITAVNIPGSAQRVATLPSGYRPSETLPLSVFSTITALNGSQAYVNTGGVIFLKLATARTNGNIMLNGTWMV